MSAMKELLMDYMDEKQQYNFDNFTPQDFLRFQTEYLASTTTIPPLAIEFFNSVIPKHEHLKRWITIINNKESVSYDYDNTDNFIKGYSKYAPLKMNTFFSPCLYDGWYKSNNARFCKVIFLDIDGITDIEPLSMSANEISDWISKTYNVPKNLLPDWCICTGHGLHLYFLVEEMDFTDEEQSRLRDHYTNMLICYFKADITCRNRNHILRLPYSNNCKQDAIQTKLYRINASSDTSMSRLDYFYRSNDEIEIYKKDSYKIRAEKAEKTRLRHQSEKKNTEVFPEKCLTPTAPDKISHAFCVPIKNLNYFDNFNRNARYWNIIKDLHNYYIRHNGNIFGFRNCFIHILATFLKSVHMPLEEATDYIEPYCTVDFLQEAQQTVEYVYKNSTKYNYSNDSIAMMLNFTEDDYSQSYCCYSEATRKERKRQANNRAKAKQYKESRQELSDKKNEIRTLVAENIDASSKDLGIICGVSTRTIQRIKKELKEEDKQGNS